MDKKTCLEELKRYVANNAECDLQQYENTDSTIKDYLNRIEDYVEAIRSKKGYSVDYINSILELASRLRVLTELKIQLSTELNRHTHIEKVLEGLK